MADVLSAYQSGWRANVFIEMKQIIETLARRWDLVLSQFSIAISKFTTLQQRQDVRRKSLEDHV